MREVESQKSICKESTSRRNILGMQDPHYVTWCDSLVKCDTITMDNDWQPTNYHPNGSELVFHALG